ncbi:LacI family DNA-binding transcriptional regulator [Cecembia calidifontis]|uniref:LacI family transcriptional regulator n=1 Tax=Cecembia calidifontis TaxID=1187080 RepID=A0A4Q7P9U0_9BACT|nr:LacI family DNA-binding transcriptional regulator [Cecembia calidifontis]RZS96348.1 LacI family transcriptional regulator [Cecembia calidifontis]
MAKKKTSIKDIAEALGISITTVSFILNGKGREKRISDEMTKKVQDYIKKIGYKPSHIAQSLRLGKSKVIVLMVEDISNQFFASIARLIEEKSYKNGYKIIYCSTDNDTDKAKELIGTFKVRNVDGFIITPTPGLENVVKELLEEGVAVVLFDRWMPEVDCSYVIVENKTSAEEATRHLMDQGCRNLGFVTVDSNQTQMMDRLAGFQEALKGSKVHSSILKVKFHTIAEQYASQRILEFLTSHPELDGVFFSTNYLAFEGLQALIKLGKKIPQQIKVVSFDDHYFFNLFQPPISAIEQPIEEIAESLMESMLKQLEGTGQNENQKIVLSNKLNVRESSVLH